MCSELGRFAIVAALFLAGCSRHSRASSSDVAPSPGADIHRLDGASALDIHEDSVGMAGSWSATAHLVRTNDTFTYDVQCKLGDVPKAASGAAPAIVMDDFLRSVAARAHGAVAACDQTAAASDQSKGSTRVDVTLPEGGVSTLRLEDGCPGQWSENGLPLAADDGRGEPPFYSVNPTVHAKFDALTRRIGLEDCFLAAYHAHDKPRAR